MKKQTTKKKTSVPLSKSTTKSTKSTTIIKKPKLKKPAKPLLKKKKNKDHLFGKTSYKSQLKPKLKNKKELVIDSKTEKIKKPRKPRSKKVQYFNQGTEDAIDLYNHTEDQELRNKIYNEHIKYPFEKLCECVMNTFKFSYFETGPLDVQKETLSHLVSNMHKFEKTKGKAFSYFSIVAKHYLIFLNNSNYKRFNQSVEIGEDREEHTVQLQAEDKYYKKSEMSEFMKLMINYWEINVGKIFSKQRDLNIANAVIELFRYGENISMFNKKALYLYIREISNCHTQQITKIINKMKVFYKKMTKSYQNDGTVNISSDRDLVSVNSI